MAVFKLLVFLTILLLMLAGGAKSYSWLNKKIISSDTLLSVIGYACLLILINIVLLFGGVYLLIYSYEFLFQ